MSLLMLSSFWVYMIALIVVGISKYKNNNASEFYLGNKKSDKYVTGISAQISVYGGYIFLTLPGMIYAFGANKAWIAAGLFLGTVVNWIVVPKRLKKYTTKKNNTITIPEYLNSRFDDKKGVTQFVCAFIIMFFLIIMSACTFVTLGKVLAYITNLDYSGALIICMIVIMIYVAVGGYNAVCLTDYIQGLLCFIGIFSISIVAIMLMGKEYIVPNIYHSGIEGSTVEFLNVFEKDGNRLGVLEIISQIVVGFGICGLPQGAIRFMGAKDGKTLVKSSRVAIVWSLAVITCSCVVGVIGRAYLYPNVLGTDNNAFEYIYLEITKKAFLKDVNSPFVAGILLCSAVAGIMAVLDSQILTGASSVANDIICGLFFKKVSDKVQVTIGRIAVVIITGFSGIFALLFDINVNEVLVDCWSCMGCIFGPVIILSLYWKRMNKYGTISGMIFSIISVFLWQHLECFELNGTMVSPEVYYGINAIHVGLIVCIVSILLVSLVTKPLSKENIEEFTDIMKDNFQ